VISPALAREALPLLSTAIAMLIEDDHALAVALAGIGEDGAERAVRLLQLGSDVAALALAMGVLARRSGQQP
jgi:chemotaxis response regulator CheB